MQACTFAPLLPSRDSDHAAAERLPLHERIGQIQKDKRQAACCVSPWVSSVTCHCSSVQA